MNISPADLESITAAIAEAVAARLANMPRLVDRYALARVIGVSVPTIERLQADGKIPVVRVNRRVLYDPEAVIAALSQNEKGGADHAT
jgi:ABC-type sugar transport system substrate-binding protein